MTSGKQCCVPNCDTSRNDHIPLHCFPNPDKDHDRFQSWIYNIGGDVLVLNEAFVFKNRKVCRRHFEALYHASSSTILKNSIPTLHVPALLIGSNKRPLSAKNNQNLLNTGSAKPSSSKAPADATLRAVKVVKPTSTAVSMHRLPSPDSFPERYKPWVNLSGGKPEPPPGHKCYTNKKTRDEHRNRNNRPNALAGPTRLLPNDQHNPENDHTYCKPHTLDDTADQDDHPAGLSTIVTETSKHVPQYTKTIHLDDDESEVDDDSRVSDDNDADDSQVDEPEVHGDYVMNDSRDRSPIFEMVLVDEVDNAFSASQPKILGVVPSEETTTNPKVSDVQKIFTEKIQTRTSNLTVKHFLPDLYNYNYVHNQNEREGNDEYITNTEEEVNPNEIKTDIEDESGLSDEFLDSDTTGDHFETVNDNFKEALRKTKRISLKRKWAKCKVKGVNEKSDRRQEHERKLAEMQKKMDEYFHVTELKTMEEKIAELRRKKDNASYINAPHKCEMCYKGFASDEAYNLHINKHTEQGGAFECAMCHLRWSTRQACTRHEYIRHSRIYSCKACRFETPDRTYATVHWRFHDATEQALTDGTDIPAGGFSCEECGVKFATDAALQQHMRRSSTHRKYNTKETRAAEMRARYKQDTYRQARKTNRQMKKYEEPVPCEKCGALIATPSEYHHHFQREHWGEKRTWYPVATHPLLCEICGKKLKDCELKDHMAEHDENVAYQCDTCGKRFPRKVYLTGHIRRHGERYACSVCGKLFNTGSNRARHVRYVHSSSQDFKCEMCGTRFKNEGSRKLHIFHIHLRNPYPKRSRQKNIPWKKRLT